MQRYVKIPWINSTGNSVDDPREWLLAYNERCASCREIGDTVKSIAGGRVQVVNLHDERIKDLRERAFEGCPPWEPTLLLVQGDQVDAWTGKMMALRLATIIGPRNALKLAEVVGRVSRRGDIVVNPSRRRFVITAVGAAAALGIGPKVNTALAQEYEPPEEPLDEESLDSEARQITCAVMAGGTITSPTKVTATVWMRSTPCVSAGTVGQVPCGAYITRYSYHDQGTYIYNDCENTSRRRWYWMSYGGMNGYVSSAFTVAGLGYDPGSCC